MLVCRPMSSAAAQAQQFWDGVAFSGRFFMGDSPVHAALQALVRLLDAEKIPYAIVGAMALNAYGYRRVTADVDVLLSPDGLRRLKAAALGRGYLEKFPGSKGMRDTVNGVGIDVLLAGDYPGDGQPKPVRFPDPTDVPLEHRAMHLLPLPRLVELKLASGLSATHRLKDLADVLELIKAAHLPRELADQLDASVRGKFSELWEAAQVKDPLSED